MAYIAALILAFFFKNKLKNVYRPHRERAKMAHFRGIYPHWGDVVITWSCLGLFFGSFSCILY